MAIRSYTSVVTFGPSRSCYGRKSIIPRFSRGASGFYQSVYYYLSFATMARFNSRYLEKYVSSLENNRVLTQKNSSYSIQRFDIILITLSTTGLLAQLTIVRIFAEDYATSLLNIAILFHVINFLFVFTIILNLIGQRLAIELFNKKDRALFKAIDYLQGFEFSDDRDTKEISLEDIKTESSVLVKKGIILKRINDITLISFSFSFFLLLVELIFLFLSFS